jgi:hypothetical protein
MPKPDNTPEGGKTPPADVKTPSPGTISTPAGGIVGMSSGSEPTPTGGGEVPEPFARAGGVMLDVGADVTSQLNAAVPSFGNVLGAIGNGVATSQTLLDKSVIDSVNKLKDKNITVVTEVVEVLNDDGLPDAENTNLITQNVSVLNYFSPTVHEWKSVSVSMDLSVGSFHSEQGLQFDSYQHSWGDTETGLFWGFLGWYDMDDTTDERSVTSKRTNEVAWQSGQIRVDALLGPRTMGKFPIPASISVGPQIYISQGSVQEQKAGNVVTSRTVDLVIEVRKSDGSANPLKNIVLNSGGLIPSFPAGSKTDADGKLKVTLTRNLFPGFTAAATFIVAASLGQMRKTYTVTL